MLDVHPPHEKIHGFRDFLLHLLTITIGLLIALGLEGCVEWNHHRHLRNEAQANLQQEIRDNQQDLASVRGAIGQEQKNLKKIVDFLQLRIDGKPVDKRSPRMGMTITTLRDASWLTASSTGALSYMEYAQVKRYAAAYQLQGQFVQIQGALVDKIPETLAYLTEDPASLSPADATAALGQVRSAISRLEEMHEIGDALDETYTKTLKGE